MSRRQTRSQNAVSQVACDIAGIEPKSAGDRKRKVKDEEEEEEVKPGPALQEEDDSEPQLRWEWEGDEAGEWTVYSDQLNTAITEAFQAGKSSVTVSPSTEVKLKVDVKKSTQQNTQTGYERRVRLAIQDKRKYFSWQWQGDDSSWTPFSPALSLSLEEALQRDEEKLPVTLGRTGYTVDLVKMVQINNKTKYQRKIQREESVAAVSVSGSGDSATARPSTKTEEEEEEARGGPSVKRPKKQTTARGSRKNQQQTSSTPEDATNSKEVVRTVVMKGKAPVDPECKAKLGKAHVYCEGEDVYDVMMNQTNLQFNNNKYYLIQLLQDDNKKDFSVWMRWGRVGKVGQNSLTACGGDLLKAKDIFKKKFLDKTKNEWDERAQFEKVAGKYDIVQMDYSTKEDDEVKKECKAQKHEESKLDKRVQSLIELISNIQAMEECILEMKFDTKKAPLGKLTVEQIKAGYQSLKKVEDCINSNTMGRALLEACNEFYTRVPHDFGLRTPPLIRTEQELKDKITLLEALSDIEIVIKMVKSSLDSTEHPLDKQYSSLHCDLSPLEHSTQEFQILEKYLQSTHASTHSEYTMSLLDVFSIEKEGESEVFRHDINNRMLLWHGSRLSNWVGILNKGLRVAPPEAPVTGYMFGKGIYFADMSSKSANYCFASRQKNVGLLLLSEVALGHCNELLAADYDADKLLNGKHSTKGLGKMAPNPANSIMLDGASVPMGPVCSTGVNNPEGYTLLYNEYIVYNPAQVRMKYLLKVQFNFESLW
ncbi:poly [ADP-ribose] polymerase 2 isoform X1 [Acipenser ruthenus]|uniref:poly [ADP-ribose] polymerase 2 isoform X1 n=1 Tax=Acipenser ruthenus TaxID=7906 RepID=UPI00145B0604|nr:poly [ADP-ribose] polymerase 2 isoform X1 [Acipenser ruthenus]